MLVLIVNLCKFAIQNTKGVLAEWLGTGLQNQLQRFESARHLKKTLIIFIKVFLCTKFIINIKIEY